MSDELLPCPFCGGPVHIRKTYSGREKYCEEPNGDHYVITSNDKERPCTCRCGIGYFESEVEAARIWNRRSYGTGKAVRKIVSDGLTGHCECGTCGTTIDPFDLYCRKCGSELEGVW